jgi:hypothetical protein
MPRSTLLSKYSYWCLTSKLLQIWTSWHVSYTQGRIQLQQTVCWKQIESTTETVAWRMERQDQPQVRLHETGHERREVTWGMERGTFSAQLWCCMPHCTELIQCMLIQLRKQARPLHQSVQVMVGGNGECTPVIKNDPHPQGVCMVDAPDSDSEDDALPNDEGEWTSIVYVYAVLLHVIVHTHVRCDLYLNIHSTQGTSKIHPGAMTPHAHAIPYTRNSSMASSGYHCGGTTKTCRKLLRHIRGQGPTWGPPKGMTVDCHL